MKEGSPLSINDDLPVYAVIMAGGPGTRFWPKSRQSKPKQFLSLTGPDSLLHAAFARSRLLAPWERCWVLTDIAYGKEVAEQLPQLPDSNIVLEPANRDTAPCIGLAAWKILRQEPNAVMVVLPSDHYIADDEAFCKTLNAAIAHAAATADLVTIGIHPSGPETGYGYIEKGDFLQKEHGKAVFRAKRFVEKPPREQAVAMLDAGGYYWNSGIFVFRADAILKAIEEYLPELNQGLRSILPHLGTPVEKEILSALYPTLPKISLDYGIMEKSPRVAMVAGRFLWDDIGTWTALARYLPKDEAGNACHPACRKLLLDTCNCIVESDGLLVATLGVQDLLIVAWDGILLVADKERSQDVKKLVYQLQEVGLKEYL